MATWYSRPGCFEWKKQTPGLSEDGVGLGSEQPPRLLSISTPESLSSRPAVKDQEEIGRNGKVHLWGRH